MVIITFAFSFLRARTDIITSAMVVGMTTIVIAYISLRGLKESFGKNLDYVDVYATVRGAVDYFTVEVGRGKQARPATMPWC